MIFRDEDVGPGLLGGLADVGIKLLHANVELIEEQEDVVDAAQSMLPFVMPATIIIVITKGILLVGENGRIIIAFSNFLCPD